MELINNKYFRAGLVVIILLMMALALKFCNKPIPYKPVEIKQEVKTRDSIIKVVEYKDSIRTVYVTKWRKIKVNPDSLPCDTFVHEIIAVCDTFIMIDSSEIVSLKGVIRQDSIIQAKQSDKISSDSLTISKLNKRLKRQKTVTKLAFGAGAVLGVAAGSKIN